MLIKIELLIISVITLKPKPSFVWLSKGSNVAAARPLLFLDLKGRHMTGCVCSINLYFTYCILNIGPINSIILLYIDVLVPF